MTQGMGMTLFFGLIALIVISLGFMFNRLVYLKNQADKAWQNIDVILKQRHDEVPKIVEVCRGSAKFEKETLEGVMRARAAAAGAGSVAAKAQAETELTGVLGRLFAVIEKYPELKSISLFSQLQLRITDLENQISDRREFYNDAVMMYNVGRESFPQNLFAGMFGMQPKALFRAAKADREDVSISLS